MIDLSGVKVGDKLIYKTQSRYRSTEIVVVTKVGRKLLTVASESGHEFQDKYRIESGQCNGDYSYGWLTTPEAEADAKEQMELWKRLKDGGLEPGYGARRGEVSAAKLRAIADILEGSE